MMGDGSELRGVSRLVVVRKGKASLPKSYNTEKYHCKVKAMIARELDLTGKDATYLAFAMFFAKRFGSAPCANDFATYFGVKATTCPC